METLEVKWLKANQLALTNISPHDHTEYCQSPCTGISMDLKIHILVACSNQPSLLTQFSAGEYVLLIKGAYSTQLLPPTPLAEEVTG